jgi:hypothetical protein
MPNIIHTNYTHKLSVLLTAPRVFIPTRVEWPPVVYLYANVSLSEMDETRNVQGPCWMGRCSWPGPTRLGLMVVILAY